MEDIDTRTALDKAAELLHGGLFEDVLSALNPVESSEPDNPWLWFYKGSAYAGLKQPYRALECFDRAAAILSELGDPDVVLAEDIRRRRQAARREILAFSLQFGPAYDTNVSFAGAGSESLGLVAGRGDGKFASGFQLSYAPIRNERDSLTVGFRLGQAWYYEVEAFNFEDYGAGIRYARTLARGWEASLAYDYTFDRLGHDNFLSNHALTAALVRTFPASTARWRRDRAVLLYQVQFQDFLFPTEPRFDRDGVAHAVGLEQSWLVRLLPDRAWTCGFKLGYRFESTATEGTEFDNFAHDFYLGLEVPLVRPWDPDHYLLLADKELVFRFDADWLVADYRNRSLTDRDHDRRDDLITTLGFTLSQTLVQDAKLGDLVVHAIILWTDAESNVTARRGVSPYTYDKVVYGLQFQWSW